MEIDTLFLSTITILADKHNVEFDIDMETHTINFTGGTDEQQIALAIEIEDVMGKYAV